MKTNQIEKSGVAFAGVVFVLVCLTACAQIGPSTIARDRFDYVSAISESWKRQTLLNLVKMRYLDAPVFMDVAAVINQYALESEIESNFSWSDRGFIGGRGMFIDRPTITYNPLMGERFARTLMRPIPLPSILLLIQSGYPVDYIFHICIQAVNGLNNGRSSYIAPQQADPDFLLLADLLYRQQVNGGFSVWSLVGEKRQQLYFAFSARNGDRHGKERHKVMDLLGLDSMAMEYRIVPGTPARTNKEIAILTRSVYQVMNELAACISVPEPDIAQGRVYKAEPRQNAPHSRAQPCLWVRSSAKEPEDPFVTVEYRGHWFWIDDNDLHTKEMFNFLLLLFSFAETGENSLAAPLITIPTN